MELITKIRQEIKRLKKEKFGFSDWLTGYETACDDILSFLDTLQEPEESCKTCGFYENNCPFIRDRFIPYPNKVCKDYTYSVMKAEQNSEVETIRYYGRNLEGYTRI